MVLIFCILRMMNSLGFFPPRFSSFHASPAVSAYEAQGMGMSYPEYVPIETAVDDTTPEPPELFLAGVPEPPEYSKPRMLLYTPYTVVQGDTIGEIAHNFGLNQDTLLSLNDIKNSRLLRIGQVLKIPNQDGILYQVKPGDTLTALAERNGTTVPAIQTANELFSETINAGSRLFIPGARLDRVNLQEINGDLFTWPVRGYVTSPYGYRPSPFTGLRQFHSGLDIGAPMGTPIRAAMAGRVSATGEDAVTGNYVVITHHSGYRTLYGHLSLIRVKAGAYVRAGERIGDVGSTGLSTGPHLHFTVYKNGVTVNPRALMN
jgi:murein DD-endopeptidase MepM/ murein hydrolase activator NlpD